VFSITVSLSVSTVKIKSVIHVAPGEHMVPGPWSTVILSTNGDSARFPSLSSMQYIRLEISILEAVL
jgi:hypothetical protein